MFVKRVYRRLKALIRPQPVLLDLPTRDISEADQHIIAQVRPFTMTSPQRIVALLDAVDYCVRRDIPGAFAECGVWQGGSVMAMILKLQQLGAADRDIYLYDTFEGMTAPTEHDTSYFDFDKPATESWREAERSGKRVYDYIFSADILNEDRVRQTVLGTGYRADKVHFVKGPVEQTLPEHAPGPLALLRLDTDWYESTRQEMLHLYPLISSGGVLIIDDYGHWKGSKQAVDEYFSSGAAAPVLLNRIDYTGRLAIKL